MAPVVFLQELKAKVEANAGTENFTHNTEAYMELMIGHVLTRVKFKQGLDKKKQEAKALGKLSTDITP